MGAGLSQSQEPDGQLSAELVNNGRLVNSFPGRLLTRGYRAEVLTSHQVSPTLTAKRMIGMDRDGNIRLLMAEEQTLLSRERTMHSYMQTGLAFTSVGLVVIKFLGGILYLIAGVFFMIVGALLIFESGRRYVRFRKAVRLLREKEARLGYEIGTMI